MVTLDIDGMDIQIRFPYSKETVERVKRLTSEWRKRDGCWLVSCSRLEEIYEAFPDAKPTDKLAAWTDLQRRLAVIKEVGHASPQPHWVERELRDHQKSAVEFLDHFSRCANLDPPGSGKTRVASTWALHDRLPGLVICPAPVKYHWRAEIQKCRSTATVHVVSGNPKAFQQNDLSPLQDADFVVLNFDLLRAWLPLIPSRFQALIIDEAQNVINARSQRGAGVLQSCAYIPNVHYLTASPSLKGNGDVESMLLGLGYLKPRERFAWKVKFTDGKRVVVNEKGVKYHGKTPEYRWSFDGSTQTELLARELETFSVRRPPEQIHSSMPAKPVHTLLEIDVEGIKEHDRMKREMSKLLKSKDLAERGRALALFGEILRWCAAAKHEAVKQIVEERLRAGEFPVVFAEYHAPLDALREDLKGRSMSFDGRLQGRREAVKMAFLAATEPMALLACRPGAGVGLDGLQHKSRTVLFAGLPPIPEYHKQAVARLAREGQRFTVDAITTVARGTAEEAVLEIVYRRAQVTDILSSSPALTPEMREDWALALGILGVMK